MKFKTILIVSATFCATLAAPNIKLPNYQFKYTVNDPNTNDHKIQVERKVGDHLSTAYVVKTIHPPPQNGFQGQPGNSYIGVSRWSGDKAGPSVTFLPPKDDPFHSLNLHPFINKFGIAHKMGLYPDVNKLVHKVKVPKVDKPSHGWSKVKPTDKVLYNHDKGLHSYHEYKKPQPKPILIIVEKRPARPIKGAYHGGNYYNIEDTIYKDKDYVSSKIPVSYDWPKRYGHSKFERDYDTELHKTDISDEGKTRYDGYVPHKDHSHDHDLDKDDDDLVNGKKKGLYHSYSWSKRYGTGDAKGPYEYESDKGYKFSSEDKDGDDDDDDDSDHSEYDAPKSSEKSSSSGYESSEGHSYKGGDKDGWYGVSKRDDDEDDDEEDDKEDDYVKSEYKGGSDFKHEDKDDFDSGKWFRGKGKKDDVYKGYDDCDKSGH